MKSYKAGQVSAQLFTKSNSSQNQQHGLASLFAPKKKIKSVTPLQSQVVNEDNHNKPTGKKINKKRKSSAVKNESESQPTIKAELKSESENSDLKKKKRKTTTSETKEENVESEKDRRREWSAPFVHESLLQNTESPKNNVPSKPHPKKRKLDKKNKDDDDEMFKRPRRDRVRDKTDDARTVFVGNCPLSADKKTLKSLFKKFGDIESIRFRCAPPADPKLPRRAIVITKNFHEQCNNYISYVVFKEKSAAKEALAMNGHVLDGLHLRVDLSTLSKKHDDKKSVFVGNLPFDVSEETLRSHFEDCGEITNVRLVRDRLTNLGKGIGFVTFDSKDSAGLALKLNETKFQGRAIRVMASTSEPEKKTKKMVKQEKLKAEKPTPKKTQKKMTFAPSNSTTATFHAKLMARKEKRLKERQTKKQGPPAEKAQSSSGVIAKKALSLKNKKIIPSKMGSKSKGDKKLKAKKSKASFKSDKKLNVKSKRKDAVVSKGKKSLSKPKKVKEKHAARKARQAANR